MKIKIETIEYPEREKTVENRIDSKGVRLDVYVKDDKERVFDLEMQVSKTADNLAKRMRYYQGIIDVDSLKPGDYYNSLKPMYIIFICPFDPFKMGRHIYTFKECCMEEGKLLLLGSETSKIILNSKGTKKDITGELKDFLDYVESGTIKGDFTKELDKAITRIKNDAKERRVYMGYEMDLLEQRIQGREDMRLEMGKIIAEQAAEIEKLKKQLGQEQHKND